MAKKKRSKKALSEAALKAWATRRAAAKAQLPRARAAPDAALRAPRLRPDLTDEAYITRVTTAIERSQKPDALRYATYVGQNLGGGWLVLVTDGFRALTRKGTDEEVVVAAATPRAVLTADPPPFGLTVTPDLEAALRDLRRGIDRKRPDVRIEIDARRRKATLRTATDVRVVPVEGQLATVHLSVQLPWLLDGFGRGGRLGYSKAALAPLVLDTSDGLRYAIMPVKGN